MKTFWDWLVSEARRPYMEPGVLQAYEDAFQQSLRELIQRTQHPTLRARLQEMLDCPIRDSRGNCRTFTDYIVSALIKNSIHTQYDMEAALGYVFEKMMMSHTELGEPRATVFSGFEERPDYVQGNPLQARFLKYLQYAVNNIRKGNIPRLRNVEQRPQGTISIGLGRQREGDPDGSVSPDEIAARRSTEADLGEMIEDLTSLLRRKEGEHSLPLAALFQGIMAGERTEEQRRRFGDRVARSGRQVIVQTIHDYAYVTGNLQLLNLLHRLQGNDSATPARIRMASKPVSAPLSDQQRDYTSILSVIDRLGRPIGTADLGRYRRRWLEYPPRDPASGYRNRLEEVLAKMVADGVLTATRTKQGAFVYWLGTRCRPPSCRT